MEVSKHLHLPLKIASNRSDEITNSFGVRVIRCSSVDYVMPVIVSANAHDEMLSTLRAVLPLLEQELKQRQASGLPEYVEPVKSAIERVKAAIAKAEGWT